MIKIFFLLAIASSVNSYAQFGEQQIITTGALNARSVYSADIDGDGDMDVLSASEGDEKIAWYENTDGFGNFGIQQIITESLEDAIDVYAADLDGDGDMDVLAAAKQDDRIVWYENLDGLGTFGTQQIITTLTDGANSVYAIDIDGDEDIDVLSSSFNDNKIAWYENLDGLGNFGMQQIITTNALSTFVVYAEDLDNDEDMDVIATSTGEAEIIWFENVDGLGNFGAEQVITNNVLGILSVFAIDIDNDGDMDILSASLADDKVAWYENLDGLGNFGSQQIITTSLGGQNTVYAADLDNDGDIDVLSSAPGDNVIAWYENLDGLGDFGTPQIITTDIIGARGVFATDIDNDGDIDVLSVSSTDDKLAWYENLTILGINENVTKDLSIYPNPTNDYLFINSKDNFIQTIEIFDILGRKLLFEKNNFNQLDVSHLNNGILFVKIETETGTITNKIIKE
jgi:hypothetical protein